MNAKRNLKLVDNTGANTAPWLPVLCEAVDAGALPEEFADVFELSILKGYNPDGSDRGILTMK